MMKEGLVYEGPPIDDEDVLSRLPKALQDLLRDTNGFISLRGGLHVRGACTAPDWHSLAVAWDGPRAIYCLYPAVSADDIPFAEDCVGDQFLLRDDAVLKLDAELGELQEVTTDLGRFWELAQEAPDELIASGALASDAGDALIPGHLLQVVPPYCLKSETDRSARAIDTLVLRDWHASLAQELAELPDGATVRFTLKE